MRNKYFDDMLYVKTKIVQYLSNIFKVYGNELLLRLEEYNLLQSENNCIESSTATGFIMEEFITSKLEIYTKNHNRPNEIKIHKILGSTVASSYDCYAEYKDIFIMINVKVEKNTSSNNAVSAINILYNDYVKKNPDKTKSYFILKTNYSFGKSATSDDKKILVHNVDGYFLEQIDFSSGYEQDHRNWSSNFNGNSGRLRVTKKFFDNHKLEEKDISYKRTKEFINKIYQNNL